jgi:hypothetical protein
MSNIQLANPAGGHDTTPKERRHVITIVTAPRLLGFIGLLFGVDNGRGADLWRSL